MESSKDKQLDQLAKKVFIEGKREYVSLDFTSKVMSQIESISSKSLVYKPLIPKPIWVAILVALMLWVVYLLKNHFEVSSGWIPSINLSYLFDKFQVSKSAAYTIVLFAFMVCVQVSLLKRYFDKRLLEK